MCRYEKEQVFCCWEEKGFLEATEKIYSPEKGNHVEMDFWSFYKYVLQISSPEKVLQKRLYRKGFILRVFWRIADSEDSNRSTLQKRLYEVYSTKIFARVFFLHWLGIFLKIQEEFSSICSDHICWRIISTIRTERI